MRVGEGKCVGKRQGRSTLGYEERIFSRKMERIVAITTAKCIEFHCKCALREASEVRRE